MGGNGAWTLTRIQLEVDTWIKRWKEGYFHPLSNFARLVEEVGELGRLINLREGDKVGKPTEQSGDEQLRGEFGDVLFVVAALGNQLGVDLEVAFAETMEKLERRDRNRFTPVDPQEDDSVSIPDSSC